MLFLNSFFSPIGLHLFYPRIRLASIMAELNAGRHFCLAMAAALVIPGQWMLSAIGLGSPGLVCTAFGFLWPMRPRGVCQQCRVLGARGDPSLDGLLCALGMSMLVLLQPVRVGPKGSHLPTVFANHPLETFPCLFPF